MTFLETVAQARALLESNGRISLRALAREFELEDGVLEELVEELVDVHESGGGEAGIAAMQQAMVELAAVGAGLGAPAFLCSLPADLWRAGRHDEALGALGGGIALAEQQGQHYYDAELHRLRAEILLDTGGKRPKVSSCAPLPAWRGSGSARASATPPAPCSRRCMPGSAKASPRAT